MNRKSEKWKLQMTQWANESKKTGRRIRPKDKKRMQQKGDARRRKSRIQGRKEYERTARLRKDEDSEWLTKWSMGQYKSTPITKFTRCTLLTGRNGIGAIIPAWCCSQLHSQGPFFLLQLRFRISLIFRYLAQLLHSFNLTLPLFTFHSCFLFDYSKTRAQFD